MPTPVRETFPTDREDLLVLVTDDGSRTFLKRGSDDAFHSGSGAATETRHVYLKNSGVADRLRVQRPTRVLEIGSGTAIYFDPFCPDSTPELWTTSCMERLRSVIYDGGRLTTYSCSRPVREALERARWDVRRVSGPPGGKRQVIVASPAVDQ